MEDAVSESNDYEYTPNEVEPEVKPVAEETPVRPARHEKTLRSQRVAGRAPYGKIPNAAEENRKAYADHEKGTVTPADVDYNIEEDDDAMRDVRADANSTTTIRSEDPHALGERFGDPDYIDDEDDDEE